MTESNSNWQQQFADRVMSPDEAVKHLRSGQRIFIGSCAGVPQSLMEAMARRADLVDTEVIHILTLGDATYTNEQYTHQFRHNAFFIGANVRDAIAACRADYTPICLSEIPELLRSGRLQIDAALISVSAPDKHGYCSYGLATDIVKSAVESARVVIAEANDQMPRVLGNCMIHASHIDYIAPTDRPVLECPPKKPNEVAVRVAQRVASLIEDGSTLQIGIGTVPNTVLGHLGDFQDLGIHTDVLTEGVIPLVQDGVITNAKKNRHRGKIVCSFIMGSRRLYEFVDDNPLIECQPTEYVNNPFIIAQIDNLISINTALEVDLTGQVCADSIGTVFYRGVGSQVDFSQGASLSRGGKPIIALPSTAQHGTVSRIVPQLRPGAGVVCRRSDVRYVVTEHGVAYLHGKTIRERALALTQVAHPKFRPWLLAEAKGRRIVYPDQIELPINPPVYPERFERPLTIKNGKVLFMRPLKLTDEALLRDMFYKLSPESIHSRFFRMLTALPHEKLQEFLRVDYVADMALLVLESASDRAQVLGIAHYSKNPNNDFAEAAFLVRDDWQGQGLGTALLGQLLEAARAQGITGFTAEVLQGNHGMLHVFHKCGFPVASELADGAYSLKIPFTEKRKRRRNSKATARSSGAK
ncbi:MAG: GNAT family N-acetyltransferase [Planctomycetota bacterium]